MGYTSLVDKQSLDLLFSESKPGIGSVMEHISRKPLKPIAPVYDGCFVYSKDKIEYYKCHECGRKCYEKKEI